jgi:hypothetical protein
MFIAAFLIVYKGYASQRHTQKKCRIDCATCLTSTVSCCTLIEFSFSDIRFRGMLRLFLRCCTSSEVCCCMQTCPYCRALLCLLRKEDLKRRVAGYIIIALFRYLRRNIAPKETTAHDKDLAINMRGVLLACLLLLVPSVTFASSVGPTSVVRQESRHSTPTAIHPEDICSASTQQKSAASKALCLTGYKNRGTVPMLQPVLACCSIASRFVQQCIGVRLIAPTSSGCQHSCN